MTQIYTTKFCTSCVAAKQFLKGKNVDFEEIDVTDDPVKQQEMMLKSGMLSVPVIDIKGTIVVGFNKTKLTKILG